jgi:hypothetical protein
LDFSYEFSEKTSKYFEGIKKNQKYFLKNEKKFNSKTLEGIFKIYFLNL